MVEQLTAAELLKQEIEKLELDLRQKREQFTEEERRLELKRNIYVQLQEASGIEVNTSEVYIPKGFFEGMEKVEAVSKYLRMIKRPAHLYDEILPALIRGGCELGRGKDDNGNDRRPRNLKIAVRMNSRTDHHALHYDARTEMVSLRGTAMASSDGSGRQYANLGKREAMLNYLRTVGKPVKWDDLVKALRRGGCELGPQAYRSLKITASRGANTELFDVRDDTIGLREWKSKSA